MKIPTPEFKDDDDNNKSSEEDEKKEELYMKKYDNHLDS